MITAWTEWRCERARHRTKTCRSDRNSLSFPGLPVATWEFGIMRPWKEVRNIPHNPALLGEFRNEPNKRFPTSPSLDTKYMTAIKGASHNSTAFYLRQLLSGYVPKPFNAPESLFPCVRARAKMEDRPRRPERSRTGLFEGSCNKLPDTRSLQARIQSDLRVSSEFIKSIRCNLLLVSSGTPLRTTLKPLDQSVAARDAVATPLP